MSGAGLIELLAARLARRAPREAAPELRQVLQSRLMRPEDIGDATRRDLSTWGPRGVAGDEILDRPIQVTPTSVDDLLASNPQFLEDPERAAEFAARSTPLPPVMMRGGKLIDGRHRLEAARIRGNDTIDAVDLDQFERPSAPSLRNALSEVNAARIGPDAGPARDGFDTERVVYRGLGRPYDAADGGYYQSFTSSLDDAQEYGSNVIAAHIRPGRNLAIDGGGNNFNSLSVQQLPADVRARLHPGVGDAATTDQIAHAAREAGYDSVTVRNVHDNRWGERPGRNTPTRTIDFVFDTKNISPLDNVPTQPPRAEAAAERVRLSDADRALLAELEDFPTSTAPDGGPVQAGNRATQEPMHPAFEGMTREEFLGSPRITTNRNAADLKPKALTTVRDQPAQPFMGGRFQVRMSEDGAAVYDGDNVIASYNFGDTLTVDRAHRRQGIAQELVYQWRTRYPGPAVARERTRASQTIQEQVWERIKNDPGNGGGSGNGSPRNGPNAGSDRNALQRALRDRMNRE